MARPSDYTPEIAAKFCGYVATHALSRKDICAKFDDLPSDPTISRWLANHSEFRTQYLEAKEVQAHIITDELWSELNTLCSKEQLEIYDRKFRFHQWHLSKLAPKIFSDKRDSSQVNVNISHEQALRQLAGDEVLKLKDK